MDIDVEKRVEKQSIQWDDQGKPLYSSGVKYFSENRNLDIYVADYDADAVVVVSAASNSALYTPVHPLLPKNHFYSCGITTDSRGNILTSDGENHRINIIDEDGHFLRFIHNCGLHGPWGLCVDSRDNLFVTEFHRGKAKNLQYYH